MLTYEYSAEILLSIYEVKDDLNRKIESHLPQCLTIKDKEEIVSKYIDKENSNLNYLRLIRHARNKDNFKISDKTRLKAKRKEKIETDKIFEEKKNVAIQKHGVSVSFPKNQEKIKTGHLDGLVAKYSYSLDYIIENNDSHTLFLNFIILFEFLDHQFRIDLVHKENHMGVMERVMGIRSENEYKRSFAFNISEMASHVQIVAYSSIINGIELSLENILQEVFTSTFQNEYGFASNARLLMPSANVSSFEKVRILAPEFESVLKQYKLFVEDGMIDFELLQMTSTPSAIKDIPSLNQNKYIYLNQENKELINCSNLFFSDQTLLAYVEPYKKKHYRNFFDLLANEEVDYNKYEEHQKPQINFLIDKGYLYLDKHKFIQFTNIPRVLILKDLFENEVASFYHYQPDFQKEAIEMEKQNMIFFESSLLSRPEQSYFNFYLNKSEFTNGMDLRNSYLHGTQANPEELGQHEYAYYTYLKLLTLVLLKIGDDLLIKK